MGGFGRADKYAAAPVSADNEHMIVNDVGERMKNLVVRIHREALDHRIMPVTPEDWRRTSFGYFKSTGASEAVKIPIDGKTVKVTTKVNLSGSRKNLVCTLDFGEYDSHCTYLNFREPIIRGLKECFELDGSLLCGRTRVEMVDKAYGTGRIHGNLWDIGRRVFRGHMSKYLELRESDDWKRNYDKFNGKLIAPPGVKLVFVPMDMISDNDGDSLFCSGIGEDYYHMVQVS